MSLNCLGRRVVDTNLKVKVLWYVFWTFPLPCLGSMAAADQSNGEHFTKPLSQPILNSGGYFKLPGIWQRSVVPSALPRCTYPITIVIVKYAALWSVKSVPSWLTNIFMLKTYCFGSIQCQFYL